MAFGPLGVIMELTPDTIFIKPLCLAFNQEERFVIEVDDDV
jgi:hypothetical protein